MASTEIAGPGALAVARGGETMLAGSRDGRGLRLGVVCARFNVEVTTRLLAGARAGWRAAGIDDAEVVVVEVPGALELPIAAQTLAVSGRVDAIACLGAVIRGETSHYDLVCGQSAAGCLRVQLDSGIPLAYGVVTTENLAQALARSGGERGDKGREAVETAIELHRALEGLAGVAG